MYDIEIKDNTQIFHLKIQDEKLAKNIQLDFDQLYTILKLTNRYFDIIVDEYSNYCIYKFNVYNDYPTILNRSYYLDFTTTRTNVLFHFAFNDFKIKKRIHIDTNFSSLINDFSSLFFKIKSL